MTQSNDQHILSILHPIVFIYMLEYFSFVFKIPRSHAVRDKDKCSWAQHILIDTYAIQATGSQQQVKMLEVIFYILSYSAELKKKVRAEFTCLIISQPASVIRQSEIAPLVSGYVKLEENYVCHSIYSASWGMLQKASQHTHCRSLD